MFPTGLTPTLTHAECIERMAVSRIFLPELRVMCRAYRGDDRQGGQAKARLVRVTRAPAKKV
jgi:hypothetical protein